MNLKTLSICLLGIVMMLASLWIGAWAMYEFAGTWMLQPIVVTSALTFIIGYVILAATVSAPKFEDDND